MHRFESTAYVSCGAVLEMDELLTAGHWEQVEDDHPCAGKHHHGPEEQRSLCAMGRLPPLPLVHEGLTVPICK